MRWEDWMAEFEGSEDPDEEYDPVEMERSFPHVDLDGGPSVPNLKEIPRDRWVDALRPLSPSDRLAATRTMEGREGFIAAQLALNELHGEDIMRRKKALAESAPPPAPEIAMPRALKPRRRETRQVSFRLSPAEYEELDRAARLYAVSGARLARMLTMRGVRRVL
jgi:hypothetical protein